MAAEADPAQFDGTPKEAVEVQKRLRAQLVATDDFDVWPPRLVAGADVAYSKRAKTMVGVVTLFLFPELEPIEDVHDVREATFPYVPGLLAFREMPAIASAFSKLSLRPDVILFDAHGYAHPRRFGLASYGGLVLGVPSIGVAKTILVGQLGGPLPAERGATAPLVDDGEVIGVALRTRTAVRPVYVSVGHRVSLETAVKLVLDCAPRYRLCEPIRRAHNLAAEIRREVEAA